MWNLQKCNDFCKSWKKQFFSFFFERFDRNLIASSLFQKNKKIRKSVFALLVCCLLMTFSPKNQENHNFFLAVASYNQIEYFSIFFMISKCRESSGANTKKYLKNISRFCEICQKHENPLTTVFKKNRTSSKIIKTQRAFLSIL